MADDLPPLQCRKSRRSGALTYPEPLGSTWPVAGHLYFTFSSVARENQAIFTLHLGLFASTFLFRPTNNDRKIILNSSAFHTRFLIINTFILLTSRQIMSRDWMLQIKSDLWLKSKYQW